MKPQRTGSSQVKRGVVAGYKGSEKPSSKALYPWRREIPKFPEKEDRNQRDVRHCDRNTLSQETARLFSTCSGKKNLKVEFYVLLNYHRKAKPTLFLISKAPGVTTETCSEDALQREGKEARRGTGHFPGTW